MTMGTKPQSQSQLEGPIDKEQPRWAQDTETMTRKNIIYGTAWKGEQTADLVYLALKSGFRAIATAAQPKHYREDLVGEGIRRAIKDGIVTRKDIFIQTTFTPYPSQDPNNLPYDPHLPLTQQVQASIAQSLANFSTPSSPSAPSAPSSSPSSSSFTTTTPYLDALILHIPYADPTHTREVWTAMSQAVRAGHVRRLGISNVTLSELTALMALNGDDDYHGGKEENKEKEDEYEKVLPTIVQNRFHPGDIYDLDVREFCLSGATGKGTTDGQDRRRRKNNIGGGIMYQTFGVLRNRAMIEDPYSVGVVAKAVGVSPEVALYALVVEALGGSSSNLNLNSAGGSGGGEICVLDGTTREERMKEDLNGIGKAIAALRAAKAVYGRYGDGRDKDGNVEDEYVVVHKEQGGLYLDNEEEEEQVGHDRRRKLWEAMVMFRNGVIYDES